MLCIYKSALADRRRRGRFPEPLIELDCGPIWDMDVIDAYDRLRDPDPRAAVRWVNYPGRWHAGTRVPITADKPVNRKRRRPRSPRLGGVAEVADLLLITKSALAYRRRNHDFPEPLAELACGPIWNMDEIDAYQEQRERDPFAAYRWDNHPGRWDRVARARAARRR